MHHQASQEHGLVVLCKVSGAGRWNNETEDGLVSNRTTVSSERANELTGWMSRVSAVIQRGNKLQNIRLVLLYSWVCSGLAQGETRLLSGRVNWP
jgi:hypothetical protein